MGGLVCKSREGLDVHGATKQFWPMDMLRGAGKASLWSFSFLAADQEDNPYLTVSLFSQAR